MHSFYADLKSEALKPKPPNPQTPKTPNPKPQNALNPWHAVKAAYAYACLSIAVYKKFALCVFVQCINPKHPKPPKPLTNKALNPKPQNALNPWHAVKPAYAYACLSIAVFYTSALCLFVQCINPKP